MKIEGIKKTIGYTEALGFSKVFEAYYELTGIEDIMEIGFNDNSGIVYIALDNGIAICSAFGNDVEFLVSDPETSEETFFDDYELAIDQIEAYNPSYDED